MSSGCAGAAERRVVHEHLHVLRMIGARRCVERRLDEAGPDGVDAHAVLAELDGERLGQAEHAVLRRGVGGRGRRAHVHEGLHRADIDDAPLGLAQLVEKRLRHVEDAVEVDADDVLPVLGDDFGLGGDGVAPRDAGIVDQDRNGPDFGGDLRGHGAAGRAVGDVEREGLSPCRPAFDLGGGLSPRSSPLMSSTATLAPSRA